MPAFLPSSLSLPLPNHCFRQVFVSSYEYGSYFHAYAKCQLWAGNQWAIESMHVISNNYSCSYTNFPGESVFRKDLISRLGENEKEHYIRESVANIFLSKKKESELQPF